jgi:hypothetical protein
MSQGRLPNTFALSASARAQNNVRVAIRDLQSTPEL